MFGLSLVTFLLLIGWAGCAILVLRLDTPMAQASKPRLITLLGIVLIVGAFFFQPWIKFSFLDYLVPTPEFIKRIAPSEVVAILVEKLGMEWLGKLIHIFKMFTKFNGWQIELIPTLGVSTRIITVFPPILAVATILTLPVCATFRGRFVSKTIGLFMLIFSIINAVLLLSALPDLDALGIQGNFQWNLFATILGAHIGNGPWFCLLGLMLLGLGGLIELVDTPSDEQDNPESY